ncbi:unnamed protein product [Pleuronectes platessa]|uniref:Uncharacterized protein n=1 Tax=Pleuronectes platessa TaxID=8262 RepID=A0A9N7YKB6_PLEPL|nr:unnamed protein product [Pleuronectes platessa]
MWAEAAETNSAGLESTLFISVSLVATHTKSIQKSEKSMRGKMLPIRFHLAVVFARLLDAMNINPTVIQKPSVTGREAGSGSYSLIQCSSLTVQPPPPLQLEATIFTDDIIWALK